MEYIITYFIFCLTTALMAVAFLLKPVLLNVKKNQPLNPVIQYTSISYIVFFSVSMILAPMMFLSVIVPSFGDRFRFTLGETLES